MMLQRLRVEVNPGFVLKILLVIEGVLVLLFVVFCGGEGWPALFRRWFNLEAENTVAAWFSSVQLGCVGLLSWLVSKNREGEEARAWCIGAALFCFFSVDEAVSFHENTLFLLAALGFEVEIFWQRVSWILLYAAVGVVLVARYHRGVVAMLRDPRRRTWLVGGIIAWLGGGMLIEGAGHWLGLIPYRGEWGSLVQVVAEEGLEMVGVSLILCGVLSRLNEVEVHILS